MLKLLLLLGAVALVVVAKAHSVVPTARGGVPSERAVILPGKGGIKTYKAVPGSGQLDSGNIPDPVGVTIRPMSTEEEEYPVDEDGSGGYEDHGGGAQLGEEEGASTDDDELPASFKQDGENDVTVSKAGIPMSDQEDAQMTTKSTKKDPSSSTAHCLVSNNTVLLSYLIESSARL